MKKPVGYESEIVDEVYALRSEMVHVKRDLLKAVYVIYLYHNATAMDADADNCSCGHCVRWRTYKSIADTASIKRITG